MHEVAAFDHRRVGDRLDGDSVVVADGAGGGEPPTESFVVSSDSSRLSCVAGTVTVNEVMPAGTVTSPADNVTLSLNVALP